LETNENPGDAFQSVQHGLYIFLKSMGKYGKIHGHVLTAADCKQIWGNKFKFRVQLNTLCKNELQQPKLQNHSTYNGHTILMPKMK
jgi:hypothetical protein